MKRLLLAVAACACVSVAVAGSIEDRVLDFPADYRETFTRYYNNDRLFAEEQTIVLYANAAAVKGAKDGSKLPAGSVLVAEIYAAKKDAEGAVIESALGRRIPGEMKAIALMERRDGWDAQYPDNLKVGDWEFEVFSADGKNLGKDTTGCRECHHPLGDKDFLWSIEHLKAAN